MVQELTLIREILAIITLMMGGALIILIYGAYRIVRDHTLLYFTYGLFALILGIAFSDLTGLYAPDLTLSYWTAVLARLVSVTGIGVMIYAVLRD
ncbi:MAG: hypothetical protein KO206_03885 [Methanomicrobiaceae archaeon]|nr:hypothetical protein [Methanomicrobiaceae archaeon]MDD5420413.1 hypothetical protein [Methanomicrobiaceae archaeon]